MKSSVYKAFIKKDLKTVFGDKLIYLPVVIVPAIFCIILPLGFIIGANFMPESTMNADFKNLPLPEELSHLNMNEKFLYMSLNTIFPSLFLLIPVMSASIIAGTGFVGERENKTIESILYTPVSTTDIFNAKVLSAFIPSFIYTIFTFLVFLLIIFIGILISEVKIVFPYEKWLVLIFWLSPAIALLSVFIMVLVSAKAKTFQQAQQRIVYIILPVILIGVGQISGLFIVNTFIIFLLGLLVFVSDYFLYKFCINSFIPEKLIT
ncbi:MAG: ABC transporter permease subunit [Ignavibacteria bacterium]|nr:ABC transporter permease subunit [Ignavibacteria bacterium]